MPDEPVQLRDVYNTYDSGPRYGGKGKEKHYMDRAYLKYQLESYGISREDLIKAEGWSPTTYSRKVVNGESDWLVSELVVLNRLGVSFEAMQQIFFEA